MDGLQIVIAALFVSAAGLNALSNWLGIPYPIPLVLGGLVLGLLPGLPDVQLDPDLVLLVFLPPLLYAAAFFADLHALRADARVISLQAIGLVLATMAAVAWVGHSLLDLTWPMAFALGAIVSPTDPAAATAIMRRVGAPRRLVNILEGESLFNDATALVALKVAVAAAIGEGVSAGETVLDFFVEAGGGIAIGLVVAFAIGEVRRRARDINTELTISLASSYGAFVPADQLGVSGVLAAVTCGIYVGFRAREIASPEVRLQADGLWNVLSFLLNAALFILIGLQLPVIVDGLEGRDAGRLALDAAMVCVAVIGMRFLYNFAITALIRTFDRRESQRARRASWQTRIVGGWSGMRGAVSLAAALSLPLTDDAGEPLPGRSLILFITFVLILVTVVGQGLTLPWLIRRLGVIEASDEEEREELRARMAIARAALGRIDELEAEDWTISESLNRVRQLYDFRLRRFKARAGKIEPAEDIEDRSMRYQRLLHEIYAAQRHTLIELRNDGQISTDVMRRVEREVDLEESRLEV